MPREPMPPGCPAAPHGSAASAGPEPETRRADEPKGQPRPPAQPRPQPSPVEALLVLRMPGRRGETGAEIPTRFRYDAAEPFAVRLTFHAGAPEEAAWVFARELLASGLRGPAGKGDVRVRPSYCPDRGAVIRLALDSPHGSATLEAVAAEVERWLQRTFALVPAGAEVSSFPSDQELAHLTGG